MENLKEFKVWDRTTRWFHWINALSVLALLGVGTSSFTTRSSVSALTTKSCGRCV